MCNPQGARKTIEHTMNWTFISPPGYDVSLLWAVTMCRTDLAALLLASGADPDTPNEEGMRPIHIAISNNHYAMVSILIAHGADPYAKNAQGHTAFHLAAAIGNPFICKLLASIHAQQ